MYKKFSLLTVGIIFLSTPLLSLANQTKPIDIMKAAQEEPDSNSFSISDLFSSLFGSDENKEEAKKPSAKEPKTEEKSSSSHVTPLNQSERSRLLGALILREMIRL